MSIQPVVRSAVHCLTHVPDLVRYGSKPRREIAADASFEQRLSASLRSFPDAETYPPNQTYVGWMSLEELEKIDRPWYGSHLTPERVIGPDAGFGEIIDQPLLFAILQQADVLEPGLIQFTSEAGQQFEAVLNAYPVLRPLSQRRCEPISSEHFQSEIDSQGALPLSLGGKPIGIMRRDNRVQGREDENLSATILLEGLCAKATGAIALQRLLHQANVSAESIDYIISCGEEATGDRYQRGGGGMAKSIGQMCGCVNASGMDVKNFCAAPASALVTAGALVASGIYRHVAVVAGGSLAKLGMKSVPFVSRGLPVLDDCLASHAFLVSADDHRSPILHLEPGAVGTASIGSSAADEAVYRQIVLAPLQALGLTMNDIDKYAPELHNPEIMEHSGSGDVVHKNYRAIAALAVRSGLIQKPEMTAFIQRIGMVGYAPPQGHIPSGVAYLGHALKHLMEGRMQRVMILSKASLFLNRLTELYDGVSFILERNPNREE